MHIIIRLFEVNETTKLCMAIGYTIPILEFYLFIFH
jgi:hypothetical protein